MKINQANAINKAQAAKNAELQHDAEILALGTYQDMLAQQAANEKFSGVAVNDKNSQG